MIRIIQIGRQVAKRTVLCSNIFKGSKLLAGLLQRGRSFTTFLQMIRIFEIGRQVAKRTVLCSNILQRIQIYSQPVAKRTVLYNIFANDIPDWPACWIFFADVYHHQDKRKHQCYNNINTTKGRRLQFLQCSRYHSPRTLFDTINIQQMRRSMKSGISTPPLWRNFLYKLSKSLLPPTSSLH